MIVVSLLLIGVAVVLLGLGLWQPSSPLLSGSIGASLLAAVMVVIGTRQLAARAGSEADETGDADGHPRRVGSPGGDGEAHRHDTVLLDDRDRYRDDRYRDDRYQDDREAPEPTRHEPEPTVAWTGAGARDEAGHSGAGHTGAGGTGPGSNGAQGMRLSGAEPVTMTIPQQGTSATETVDETDDVDPPDEPAAQQVSAADAARVGRMNTEVLVVDGRPRYHLPGCVHLLGRESEPLPVNEAVELGFSPCSLCEPDSALLADARRV